MLEINPKERPSMKEVQDMFEIIFKNGNSHIQDDITTENILNRNNSSIQNIVNNTSNQQLLISTIRRRNSQINSPRRKYHTYPIAEN